MDALQSVRPAIWIIVARSHSRLLHNDGFFNSGLGSKLIQSGGNTCCSVTASACFLELQSQLLAHAFLNAQSKEEPKPGHLVSLALLACLFRWQTFLEPAVKNVSSIFDPYCMNISGRCLDKFHRAWQGALATQRFYWAWQKSKGTHAVFASPPKDWQVCFKLLQMPAV